MYTSISFCITDRTQFLFEIVLCTGFPDAANNLIYALRSTITQIASLATCNIEPNMELGCYLMCEGSDIDLDMLVLQEIFKNAVMLHT
jgi:hypothetical protein